MKISLGDAQDSFNRIAQWNGRPHHFCCSPLRKRWSNCTFSPAKKGCRDAEHNGVGLQWKATLANPDGFFDDICQNPKPQRFEVG